MEQLYFFSDDGCVHFDPRGTVGELVHWAYDRFHYTEAGGLEQVTVYDTQREQLVTDRTQSCEELSPRLAFAYLIPGEFCCVPEIGEDRLRTLAPQLAAGVSFRLSAPGFEGTPLVRADWTLEGLLSFLQHNGWTASEPPTVTLSENYYRVLDPAAREQLRASARVLDVTELQGQTLKELGLQGKLCRIV